MDNHEIEKLIEAEKHNLASFLKMAEKFQLSEEDIEEQTNFHLDKITELKQLLKE